MISVVKVFLNIYTYVDVVALDPHSFCLLINAETSC